MSVQGPLLRQLDQSSFTGQHRKIYGIALVGHLIDGFDINVIGFALPGIIAAYHLTGGSAGFLASAVFFGMFFGAGIGGLVADSIGRKRTIIASMILYGLASLAVLLTSTYTGLWLARAIQGIGLGGEVILLFSYLAEFLPAKTRGTITSSTVFFWQISSLIAALLAIPLIPAYGWQVMFVVGGIPALIMAILWWILLPESVRFLLGRGRVTEARAVVARISGATLAAEEGESPLSTVKEEKKTLSDLLRPTFRIRSISVWVMQFIDGFVFFGLAVWLPSMFLKMGVSFAHSLEFTAIITGAGALGNVVGGLALDHFGRRPTIIWYQFIGGVALGVWGLVSTVGAIVTVGAVAAFFAFGVAGPLFLYVTEVYPTSLRATGTGVSGSWQRVGGIVAPYVLGLFVAAKLAPYFIFGVVGILMVISGIVASLTVIETKQESLEVIQTEITAEVKL